MKKLILSCAALSLAVASFGQVTITQADMPAVGDSLRSSIVISVNSGIDLSITGANINWDFSQLEPVAQTVDRYKSAVDVNPVYALTISPNAYGYEVADTFELDGSQLPVSVTDVYNFFSKKSNPSRFVVEGFAANVNGFPTAATYSNEDVWYIFPVEFGNTENDDYKLTVSVASLGSLIVTGNRTTTVDGWGTIKTPHFTTAVSCLRVRSEIDEIDTITSPLGDFEVPRKTVEYRWLVPGEHYPALWVTEDITTGDAEVTSIRFRDNYREFGTSIADAKPSIQMLTAYPVPANGNVVTVDIPQNWKNLNITVFDRSGKIVSHVSNSNKLNTAGWASGDYIARVISGNNTGYVRLSK